MKQVIDMGGFKNQEIEVVFGDDIYNIQLDPPIEIYRQVMAMQGKKLKIEEDWNEIKKVVTEIVCANNSSIDKDKFFKSLTKPAAVRFLNAYTDLLYKGSGLKNSSSPLNNPAGENKEEKEKK